VEPLATSSLPEKEIKEYTEKEVHMAQQDRVVEETGEARNALESYVLDTRSKIQDESELQPYIKDQDAKGLLEAFKEAEDWLEGDGFDGQKSEYVSRLEELAKKGDPVYRRKREAEGRGELVERLKSAIGKYSNFASSTDEKYSHIEDADKKKIAKLANEIDQWLAQSLSKQDRVQKTEDPFLTLKLLRDKLDTLEKESEPIMNKPKPKPKEEPKKEEPKKDEAKKDETKKDEAKKDKDEPKKDEPKKDGKKEEPKKEEPKKDKDDGKDKDKEQVSKKAKTGSEKDGTAKMDTS